MSSNIIFRNKCPLCGSSSKRIVSNAGLSHPSVRDFLKSYYKGRISFADLQGWRYEIAICLRCAFIWQTYILGDFLMSELYSKWISPEESLKKKEYAGAVLHNGYVEEAGAISLLFKKNFPRAPVLDYGMGWGVWCVTVAASGHTVFGYEIDSQRILFARNRGVSVIDEETLTGMRFGFINCEQVIEHVSDPKVVLEMLARSLASGGYIRIAVPNGADAERLLASPFLAVGKNAIQPLEHINCFTRQTLLFLAASVGLLPMSREMLIRKFFSLPRLLLRHLISDTSIYFFKPGNPL